jgi:hypothetical protein
LGLFDPFFAENLSISQENEMAEGVVSEPLLPVGDQGYKG